jgi:hypothetical protein
LGDDVFFDAPSIDQETKMTEEAPPSNSNPSALRPWSKLRKKAVIWTAIALVILFWDEAFEITVHVLHIIIEYLELAIEDLILFIFPVEEHESQMFTAWIGFGSFIALGAIGYLRVMRWIRREFRTWAYFWSWIKIHFQENWIPVSLIILLYFGTLFLF